MQAADSSIKVPSDDLPAAVPALIEAAVAAFDADRHNSRRYLLRASALLSLNRRAYVAMRRVEFACTMLTTTREPLSQVALACGLSDQAHLCKLFRRTIGMNPSAWRRAMTVRYTAQDASGEYLRLRQCAS